MTIYYDINVIIKHINLYKIWSCLCTIFLGTYKNRKFKNHTPVTNVFILDVLKIIRFHE